MTHFPPKAVLILLATSSLAACATPQYPVVVNPPPPSETSSGAVVAQAAPQPAPPPAAQDATPDRVQPAAPVEARPLESPPPAARAPVPTPPPPPPPAEPTYRTVTTRSVTGRVVDVEAPGAAYTVDKGDTLARIARKLDTDIEQLAKDNKLKKPYVLQPGQKLTGPPTSAKAYVVGSGDTLGTIARRFSVSVEALRAENGLSRNAALSAGRRLVLPDGYRDRGPITSTTRVAVGPASAPQPVEEAPPPRRTAGVAPASEPAATTRTTRSVTGRVVDVEGPAKTYQVKKGDNLTQIANRLDTTVEQLAKDNNLKAPYRVHPGQTLKGPRSTAKAYVVGDGDTLAAIGQRFSVSVAALRGANGLSRTASAAPGRRLRLPAGYRDRGPIVSTTRVAEAAPPTSASRPPPSFEAAAPPARTPPPARVEPERSPGLPSAPQPYTPGRQAAVRPTYTAPPGGIPGAPVATPAPSDAQITQMGRGVFIWPVRGEVLSNFGPKSGGEKNDGLNIRAGAGETVRAAAAGDVVYAGDQVPGFGNLVLIKHADGWVTAYGHLSRVDVRMQERVEQGQQIGQVGTTGGVSEPQVHFEVRYASNPQERARPINPQLVLPR